MLSNPVNPFVPDFTLDLPTAWVWLVSAIFSPLSLLPNPQSKDPCPLSHVDHCSFQPVAKELCLFVIQLFCAVNKSSICQDVDRVTSDAALHTVFYQVGFNHFIRHIHKLKAANWIYVFIKRFPARMIPLCTNNPTTGTLHVIHKSSHWFNLSHERPFICSVLKSSASKVARQPLLSLS